MEEKKLKLRLDVFYKTEEKQYIFLRRLALTYRASLPLLSELFQISQEELKTKLRKYNDGVLKSLTYLFNYDISNQDNARNRIIMFYKKILTAMIEKDEDTVKSLIDYISDSKMKKLIKIKTPEKAWSNEDILTLLNYQLKYALTLREVSGMVRYNAASYQQRVIPLLEENPKLKENYVRLAEYNLAMHDKSIKAKRS